MKNNTIKKVMLSLILVIIVIAIIYVIINSSSGKKQAKVNTNSGLVSKGQGVSNSIELKKTTITNLEDGIKYSVTDKEIKPDIIIGDNYYGTQISDININFEKYEGKTIEIEGLYFEGEPFTFIGRYSTSVVCADCPVGYSYFEYEWKGDESLPVTDSESWMKMRGTLRKGNDGEEYYYIDVAEVEIMNKPGIDTVSN